MTVLNDASLEAVLPEADDWSAAQAAARAAPGASTTNMRGAGPEALGDAEQPGPPVLPGLTYLCLQQHHLLRCALCLLWRWAAGRAVPQALPGSVCAACAVVADARCSFPSLHVHYGHPPLSGLLPGKSDPEGVGS